MKTLKLFTLILFVCFAGCKKDPDPEPQGPLLIPQEVKDYVFFQPGTYWIYIDSVSGRVDSMYVWNTKTGFDTMQLFDYPKRAYEWIETFARSAMDGYDYYFYSSTSYSVKDESKVPVYVIKQKPGDYAGQSLLFVNPSKKDEFYFDGNGLMTVKQTYETLTLNSHNYKNVLEIFHDKSPVEISNNITKFIALNFGVVRKEYVDSNQIWILARSNIIQ